MTTTTQINATPRDKYWYAVYLRMTADAARDHGCVGGTLALLEQAAQVACEAYCIAQVEADELNAAIKDD
jgi:hypothetical protein